MEKNYATTLFECPQCKIKKNETHFFMSFNNDYPLLSICNKCSDEHLIEKVLCTCSVCNRKLPSNYFQHYRSRIKKNKFRLRTNLNCKDCSVKESGYLTIIKRDNPPPEYNTPCQQCNKIVYEKAEDIPDGSEGTNGPWQCDHDHITKEFRRYLCKRCNTGTGLIGDSQQAWEVAVPYKKKKS